MFICCCSFLLHQSMKQWKNLIIYVIRNSNQDFFPCTFHISECRQYLLVDDNIKILELKVQMPILIFLILLISSSTILWSHSITVLGFNSFKANSILGSIWKDSLCDPNNLSNIFYLANQAFLYDIPYKKKKTIWIVAWIVAILILISALIMVNIILANKSDSIC
jgi:hypothetical protein